MDVRSVGDWHAELVAKGAVMKKAVLLAALASCSGTIAGTAGDDTPATPTADRGGGIPGPAAPAPAAGAASGADRSCLESVKPDVMSVRRLNRRELVNSLQDLLLLPATTDPLPRVDLDDTSGGFTNRADVLHVDDQFVDGYAGSLLNVVDQAVVGPRAAELLACTTKSDEGRCAQEILSRFAARAFRRPLESGELGTFMDLYGRARAQGAFTDGIADGLAGILVAPDFLYHMEGPMTAAGGMAAQVLAARLAFFLWSGLPDDALATAVQRGELATMEGVKAQVARLLKSPRAESLVSGFMSEWLQLRNLGSRSLPDALRKSMQTETQMFAREVVLGGLPMTRIVGADFTFLDKTLAANYKLGAPAGTGFSRVNLAGSVRTGGVLTQASFLALTSSDTETSPTHRGLFVLSSLLCSPPPPPPPGAANNGGMHDTKLSVRDNVLLHSSDPACRACHQLMDPIGLGLENFDTLGAYRTLDQGAKGAPVDPSGQLDSGARFANHTELAQLIANDPRLRRCAAEQVLGYALARRVGDDERCLVDYLSRPTSGGTFADLATDLAGSPVFRPTR
jgi:hypothetical protein